MIILHNAIRTSCAFVRGRIGSLADVRMRICHQNNGGSNISKREINKLSGRNFFPIVHLFCLGSSGSNKVSFYRSIRVKIM